MAEHTPFIDYENLPSPTEGFTVTLFLTVKKRRAGARVLLGGPRRQGRARGEPVHGQALQLVGDHEPRRSAHP